MSFVEREYRTAVAEMSRSAALDKLPISAQAMYTINALRGVEDYNNFVELSIRWSKIRNALTKYEGKAGCEDSGAARDRDIFLGLVDDLYKAPIAVLMSVSELVVAIMDSDKSEAAKNLDKAIKDAIKEGLDRIADSSLKKIDDKTKKLQKKSADMIRDALLRYLQSVSKRSRKHFAKIIGSIAGLAKTGAKVAGSAVGLIFTSSRITPEWCGLLKLGDEVHKSAFARVSPRVGAIDKRKVSPPVISLKNN